MGMWDIVMRMLLCLLLAFLLGLVLGWLLKKLFGKDNCEECETRLRDLERELETSNSSLVKLKGETGDYSTQISSLETSLSKAKADLEARDADVSSWEQKYLVIEKDSQAQVAKLADFEANATALTEAQSKLKSAEDDNRRLTSQISNLSTVIDKSKDKNTEIDSLKAQISRLEAELEDSNLKLAGASAAGAVGGAVITSTVSDNDDEIAELRRQLSERDMEIAGLNNRLSLLQDDKSAATPVPLVSSTETDYSDWDSDYEAIRLKMDNLEYLATDDEEDTEEDLNGWITETEDLQGRIRALRADAGERDESRNTGIAELEATSVSLMRILEKAKADKLAGIAKIRRKGYELGIRDDLKLIVGVGPVLEKLLNNNDVWTFKQIAQWSDADVAEMSEKLEGFQDRIEREDWVGQSKQIHADKYGETL